MVVAKREDAAGAVSYQVLKPVSRAYSPRSRPLLHMTSTEDEQPDRMVVEFVLFKALPDPEPVVVRRKHQLVNFVITFYGLIHIITYQ
jgi:hypothetical protein